MEHMLTTVDNPWNPFTHWDEWYEYDRQAGYNTPSLLARVANVSDELPDDVESVAIEDAISWIVENNVLGIYRKVAAPVAASA